MKKIIIFAFCILIVFSSIILPTFYVASLFYYNNQCKSFNGFFEIYSIIPEPMCYFESHNFYIPLNNLRNNEDKPTPIMYFKKYSS